MVIIKCNKKSLFYLLIAIILFTQKDLYAAKEAESNDGSIKVDEICSETEDDISNEVVQDFLKLMGEKDNQVKLLVEYCKKYGEDILNKCDDKEQTALHKSAIGGFDINFKYLLDMGANWKLKDKFGKTPLNYAAELKGKEQKAISRVYTFFFIKRKWLEAAKAPNKLGALQSLHSQYGKKLIDVTMYDGKTALMEAAHNGAVESFKFLLANGANIKKKDKQKKSVRSYISECKDKVAASQMSKFFKMIGKPKSSGRLNRIEKEEEQKLAKRPTSDINTAKKSSSVKKPTMQQLVKGNQEKILKVEKQVQAQEHRHSLVQREIGNKVEVNTEEIRGIKLRKKEETGQWNINISSGLLVGGSLLIVLSVAAAYALKKN